MYVITQFLVVFQEQHASTHYHAKTKTDQLTQLHNMAQLRARFTRLISFFFNACNTNDKVQLEQLISQIPNKYT